MTLKNSKVEMKQLAADIFKIFSLKFKKTFSFIVISEERELMFVFKALVNRGILDKRRHRNVFSSEKYINELNFNFLKG